MNADIYWIWLSKVKISVKLKNILINKYKTPKKIWNLKENDLEKILSKNEIVEILNPKYKQNLDKELEFINKYKIKIINYLHEYYPDNLKNIYDKPIILYAIGNMERLKEKSIAIVGTRNCTKYGKMVAKEISKTISSQNVNIISGLAKGIDGEAHKWANGKTIAVLGSGINVLYPKENLGLAKSIIHNGGLIITEYPIDEKPEKLNFPNRNRIISGIAEAVVVIEARKRSGSLITADFAIEQGKDVYAIPGNITSVNSQGTNALIYEGAIPLYDITQIKFSNKN